VIRFGPSGVGVSDRFVPMSLSSVLRRALRPSLVSGTAAVLLAGVVAMPTPAQAVAEPGEIGIGDPYFPLDGNGGIDVKRYRIRNRYDFDAGRLAGRTRLTVRATQDLSRFHLDFLLPVREVRLDGQAVRWAREGKHDLTIDPETAIARGERFAVTVRYAGRPDRYGYLGERNWLANQREVVAMNQPHMAPWWFPSNDHPRDKAKMDISLTVPKGKQVLANGERVSREVHGTTATTRYVAAEPMATYLAVFAAGRFDVVRGTRDGVAWTAAVSRLLSPAVRESNMDLMRRTPRVMAGLAEDLGEYPFTGVGGLVTALDVGFALETQTLATYPPTGRDYTWLVVHEVAHQWFGNSVALRRWRDIWLNEGAATFMEKRWTETHGGQSAAAWLRQAYDARLENSSFWDLQIGDPGPDHLFAGQVYLRGAMTFQALRNRIGEDDFWTLLQRWVSERRDGHGTSRGFEALAEEVSGEQLDDFFRVWLEVGSKPADIAANGLG
jgi:aminopeptidase N